MTAIKEWALRLGKSGTAAHHPTSPFPDRAGKVSLGANLVIRRAGI